MNVFLPNRKLIIHKNAIKDMWTDHFEYRDIPSARFNFDNDFYDLPLSQRNFYINSNGPVGALKNRYKRKFWVNVLS